MKTHDDVINKVQVSLFHMSSALGKARAFANTKLGDEVVSDITAAKSVLLSINIKPEDLLDKT